MAFTVTEFIEKYFSKMMQYKFTKDVEADFDKVENWEKKFTVMFGECGENTFKKDLEEA